MPINLIDDTDVEDGEKGLAIGYLCDEEWEMPKQIAALEVWLSQNMGNIKRGSYVADIGFSPREGAAGGGAVLTVNAMRIMVTMGMELYLSEYPAFDDE